MDHERSRTLRARWWANAAGTDPSKQDSAGSRNRWAAGVAWPVWFSPLAPSAQAAEAISCAVMPAFPKAKVIASTSGFPYPGWGPQRSRRGHRSNREATPSRRLLLIEKQRMPLGGRGPRRRGTSGRGRCSLLVPGRRRSAPTAARFVERRIPMLLRSLCLGLSLAAALAVTGCSCGHKCCRPAPAVSQAPPCCPGPAPCCPGPAGPAPVQAYSIPAVPGCCGGR